MVVTLHFSLIIRKMSAYSLQMQLIHSSLNHLSIYLSSTYLSIYHLFTYLSIHPLSIWIDIEHPICTFKASKNLIKLHSGGFPDSELSSLSSEVSQE
jgi:hypothetical protein